MALYRAVGGGSGPLLSLLSSLLSPFKSASKKTILPTGVTRMFGTLAHQLRLRIMSPPCMCTCQHRSVTLRSRSVCLRVGSQPVPATSKSEIDAALQKLAANKQKWIAQPCSRRAALLRACIQQALKVKPVICLLQYSSVHAALPAASARRYFLLSLQNTSTGLATLNIDTC